MAYSLRISWRKYFALIEELARRVRKSRWCPDMIIAIPKGGNLPADILARLFKAPIAYLPAESYTIGARERGAGKVVFARTLASTAPGVGEHVLIVDDLDDSGQTLEQAKQWLSGHHPEIREMRTAVLWHKTCSRHEPDFFVTLVKPVRDNKWPWLVQPFEKYERMNLKDL